MAKSTHRGSTLKGKLSSIDAQMPTLTYYGLAFWMAWNLIAFSGSVWLIDTDTGLRVSDLFVAHLSASVATLLIFGLLSKKLAPLVAKNRFVFIGAAISLAGGIGIILSRPSIFGSAVLFILSCIATGAGTSLLFIRCSALYGALNPRRSFIRICESMLVAGATYCILKTMPESIGTLLFVLLPLISALLLSLRSTDRFGEKAVLEGTSHFTRQFYSFLVAVVVFAAAAQTLKGALISLPPAESTVSYDYMLILLIITCIVFIAFSLLMTKPMDFGVIYRPATLTIIALLIIVPLFNIEPVAAGAFSSAANYAFNLMVWGMLAYIVYQAQADAVKVFCLGNAALAGGSVIGSLLSIFLLQTGMDHGTYLAICLLLALAAIVVAIFIFPEHKISELLLPVDEKHFETDDGKRHYAPWKEASERLAAENGLSERETEVFLLLAKGKTTQQVSDMLVISPYTTRAHVRSIYAKLDVHSRSELSKRVDEEMKRDLEPETPH